MKHVLLPIAVLSAALPVALAQDFNGNAVRDSIDLRNGTSQDCNHNGVPDEVEAARPDFAAAVAHHSDSATLTNVNGVAVLDADLDGDLDVMATSRSGQNNSSLTLWRNDGGAGLVFHARTTVVNALCHTVRAADLNNDGRTDIVSSDGGFPQVVVMLATGANTFAAPTFLAAGSRGTGLAVGDLDGDSDVDVAMPGVASNAVDVFRNNGNGTFTARTPFACGQQPVTAAIGDITGDGLADIAVGNSFISAAGPGTVTLLRNTGGAVFVAHATLTIAGHAETSMNSSPHDVVLADINSDGDSDLLVSSKDSNSLRIYSNDGGGTMTNTQTLGPLESIGGIADRLLCTNLDGDPAPELAWADSAARAVRVYDNNAGTFAFSQSYGAGSEGPVDVTAGDLTGDGLPDLVAAGSSSSAFSTIENTGGLNFDGVIHIRRADSNFYPILADFTGDGVTDLASYSTGGTPAFFHIAPGIGGNRFGPAVLVPLPSGGHVLARDLNNDGLLDILSLGNSGNRFAMLNTGGGAFAAPIFSSVINVHGNWQTADMNNDGHLDFLWTRSVASNQPHFIAVSLGDGQGHFAPPYEITTPAFLGSVWTGDLSGDGFPEIFAGVAAGIVGPLEHESFIVYPNNGDNTFGAYEVHAYELQPGFAGSVGAFAWADIDGDGDSDLLGAASRIYLFRNNGHTLAAPVMLGGFANYSFTNFGPAVMDADQDGDLDFFGISSINGVSSHAVFLNDGAGGFGAGDTGPRVALMRYRAGTDALTIADIDANGRPDILAKPSGFADWYVHLGMPPTTDCNANSVPDSCDIAAGTLLDTDGDGVPDVCEPGLVCDSVDFNNDGLIPDTTDIADFISVFSGGACSTGACNDIDFNNDTLFPDTEDIHALLRVFAGGEC